MRKALIVGGLALLAAYVGIMRERVIVTVTTLDGLDATVLVSVIAVYRKDGVEHATPPRTLVVASGRSGTLKLSAKWPWQFERVQILAGHPRYRLLQHYEVHNPHWRSRRIDLEMASWTTKPDGRVVIDFDNRAQEAEEHLSWLREAYLPTVDPLISTRELVESMPLLQAIAFAGRQSGPDGMGPGERIANSMAALEDALSRNQSEPCPPDYVVQPGETVVCGQKQIDVVWPRR